jgi:TRAP-type C4-dicarboxylate transport system substrate-binding protein
MSAKIVSALGAVPVAMPMTESYDSLQKGITEGIVCPIEALEGLKLGEVVKATTESYITAYTSAFFVTLNKEKWSALPSDIQKIIEKANDEWIEKSGRAWDEIDKSGREFVLKRGNQIIPLSKEEAEKWAKAVAPISEEYLNTMKSKGLPGDEALKFCLEYLKKNQ